MVEEELKIMDNIKEKSSNSKMKRLEITERAEERTYKELPKTKNTT